MSTFPLTGSQTVGPFFSPALLREAARRNVLTQTETAGERIRIEGRVLDGDGIPVPDAMVEIWQANAHGRYNHPADSGPAQLDPSFLGFGRSGTAEDGSYWFETVKPGPVAFDRERLQAPHICVAVFSRGLLNHLVTRLYFEDEPANAEDPVLQCVPDDRRVTLLARREPTGAETVYCFDIVLQGAGETAFFNV
ncbi:MAG TPA: protocatechuate 3,4-dioxygenase subunit alpha [Ktedonobacteraceae bacterium]|nr:protocatechuate 3,4-dioxygenase subunit alpha [Ktedonobacteraceae bacterium]